MDEFQQYSDSVTSPARSVEAIVPSDSVPLVRVPKAIFVGGAGDVHLRAVDDNDSVSFRNVPAGTILPVRATMVLQTGTTALHLVALS